MVDYSKIAFSDIRSLLWNELKSNSILLENNYWAETFSAYLNPIIPSQQVPEFQNLLPGKTYIVYDIEESSYDADFWKCLETATLTVIGNSYAEIYSVLELIKDVFRRFDISARDVNINNTSSPYNFLYIYIDGMMSPEYGSDEGGYLVGTIKISYEYTRNIGSNYRYS